MAPIAIQEGTMPLRSIQGHYHIQHSQPDGDSIHFHPNDPTAFATLYLPAQIHADGGVQLRLDAIDALETHYSPRVHGGFLHHQPLGLAHAAAQQLVELLGFTGVQREGETVTDSTPAQTEGSILTRFADKYGRPVAFAYAGHSDQPDLGLVRVDEDLLMASVNYQLAAQGLVYPTYYSKLYPDLRNALTAAVKAARAAKTGIWDADATTAGAQVTSLAALDDELVIMPKLFRRLVDYLALGADGISLAGFGAFLAARDDRLFIISDRHATGLDNIVEVSGQTVRLSHPPDDLIFLEA
jgi:endonuclease YncB( thermonuclease family)